MKYLLLLAATLLFSAHIKPVQATVLTFDTIPTCFDPVADPTPPPYYTEAGYGVSGIGGSCYGGFQDIYMVYAGDLSYHTVVDIERADGSLFTVAGFDVLPAVNYFTDPDFVLVPGDDVVMEGYLGSALVGSLSFSSLLGDTTVSAAGFTQVDRIRFTPNLDFSGALDFSQLGVGGGPSFDNYSFSIDNLDLRTAEVPVPPAIAGMGLALLMLGGLRRLRKG